MRPLIVVVLGVVSISCGSAPQDSGAQSAPPDVIAMERAALDRWGKGDPQGYLEIMANEMTYFDMETKRSLIPRLQNMLVPGGHLIIGSSESRTAIPSALRMVEPSVYRLDGGRG